jgi:hypothetical protein
VDGPIVSTLAVLPESVEQIDEPHPVGARGVLYRDRTDEVDLGNLGGVHQCSLSDEVLSGII